MDFPSLAQPNGLPDAKPLSDLCRPLGRTASPRTSPLSGVVGGVSSLGARPPHSHRYPKGRVHHVGRYEYVVYHTPELTKISLPRYFSWR